MGDGRERGRYRTLGVALLFILSGATGLIYEVVWFKRFCQLWGGTAFAIAAVTLSFLTGLGAGAWVIGRSADRVRSPLRAYALCELGIGLLGWLSVALLLDEAGFFMGVGDRGGVAWQTATRIAVALALIGPPAFLMGGTLPLLVRHFAAHLSELAGSVGWLYAANALGGALGCFVGGFHWLPAFGLRGTALIAASLNVTVAVASWILARRFPAQRGDAQRSEPASPMPASVRPRKALWFASAATGCAALSLQCVWNRQLALIVGGSTYAFSATLCVILVGIAAGGLLFHLRASRWHSPFVGVWTIAFILVSCALTRALMPHVVDFVGYVAPLRGSPVLNGLICLGASATLDFLPALGMGFLFPLLVHQASAYSRGTGQAVGTIYALNTLGTVVGAALTTVFIVPALGMDRTVALALWLYLAAALALIDTRALVGKLGYAGVVVMGVGATLYVTASWDPLVLNSGVYMYGKNHNPRGEVLAYYEGRSSNVMVVELADDTRHMRVNGKIDASDLGDMKMQLGLAYFPRFLRPEAGSILAIGFGSGTSVGASLVWPGADVTCVEIEPTVYEVARWFTKVNHDPLSFPNLHCVVDDARGFLNGSDERFDLILSEPSNPWIDGVGNLFTKEFYGVVRSALSPGGVFAQWIQMYSLSPAEYRAIVATMTDSFEHCALVRISNGDTVLLACAEPLLPDAQTMSIAQARVDAAEPVRSDLQRYFETDRVHELLVQHLLLGTEELLGMIEGLGPRDHVTDANMRLTFDAPLRLFASGHSAQNGIANMLWSSYESSWTAGLVRDLHSLGDPTEGLLRLFDLMAEQGAFEKAPEVLALASDRSPDHPRVLFEQLVWDEASMDTELVVDLIESSPRDAFALGTRLIADDRVEDARIVLERLAEARGDSATLLGTLACSYFELGDPTRARELLDEAMRRDPYCEAVRRAKHLFDEHASEEEGASG